MNRLAALFAIFLLTGCSTNLVVKRDASSTKAGAVDGIPFFVKTGICKHQTVWLQPVYTVTLKATFTPSDKNLKPLTSTRSVVLTLEEVQTPKFVQFMKAVAAGGKSGTAGTSNDEIRNIEDSWTSILQNVPPDPYTVDESQFGTNGKHRGRVLRVANEIVPESYVDYSTMYFFNTKKPLSGSAQGSVKLAGDGTMTEGSGQIESKTLQTFLDLLPVKDVLTTVAKGQLPLVALEGRAPSGTATYDLAITAQTFKHTHYRYLVGKLPPCSPPADELLSGYALLVEDVTEQKKKSGEDDQTVSVTGTVKLPKPKTEEKK